MVEAWGTITQFYEKLRHQFGLDSILTDNILVLTITGSPAIDSKSLVFLQLKLVTL